MLDAINSIVDFLTMVIELLADLISYMPVFTRMVFHGLMPFLHLQDLLPVYFYPFISFTLGATILLLIVNRGNNRG